MSAVFGLWNLDGRPVQPEKVNAMAAAMRHRAPDGVSVWIDGTVALGHGSLHTGTPEEHYAGVSASLTNGCRLTADLRLDNRQELKHRLSTRDLDPRSLVDTDLVLAAYSKYGADLAKHLLGDFAFAIWDPSAQRFVCVRDHFGVRPLHYIYLPGRCFAFASEAKALLSLGEVSDEVDELEIARHLMLPVGDDLSASYYRAIKRLKPAHTLIVTHERLTVDRYWRLGVQSVLRGSAQDYADAVREVFVEAVRCRVPAGRPVASMLSGGIDSSSITCVAGALAGEADHRIRTLSAIYTEVPESDERPYIDRVLESGPFDSDFFVADGVSPIADIDTLNWLGDGANKAGNLYLNWNLYRIAASRGARVVLDGYDGDSTVSHGHGFLPELALSGRWLKLARETWGAARMNDEPWLRVYAAWLRRYSIDQRLRTVRKLISPNAATRSNPSPLWSEGLTPDYREWVRSRMKDPDPEPRTETEHHLRLLERSILLQALGWVEAIGAGAGVEVRFPFFDVRLAELCVSLPTDQKVRNGWTRLVMRRAMAATVPPEICWRPTKSNLQPGFDFALRTHARGELATIVRSPRGRLESYFARPYLARLHDGFMAGTTSPRENLRFWRAISLALWLAGSDRAFPANGPAQPGGHTSSWASRAPVAAN